MAKEKKTALYRIAGALLLLLFMLGGGYYIAIMSEDSAQQIGAGKDYERLSKNSRTYSSSSSSEEGKSAFFDKNDISNMQSADISSEDMNNALLHSGIKDKAKENLKKGSSVSMASSIAADRINNPNADFFADVIPGNSSGGTMAAGGSSGLGGFSSGSAGTKNVSSKKHRDKSAAEADAEHGLLGALKGVLRNSILGQHAFSRDAAKDFGGQSFDGNISADSALQYDEGMRLALDYMDPNGMPQFLREQEADPDEKGNIDDSKVADMAAVTEYDADEEQIKEPSDSKSSDESYSGFYKAVDIMLPGMMNPIFTGFVPRYQPPEKSPYDIARSNLGSSRPSDLPTMAAIDDADLITYGSKKGFQVVYDMQGNFIGCIDNKTRFFKAAGTPGCPR